MDGTTTRQQKRALSALTVSTRTCRGRRRASRVLTVVSTLPRPAMQFNSVQVSLMSNILTLAIRHFRKYIDANMNRQRFSDPVASSMTKYLDERVIVETCHAFHRTSFPSITFTVVIEFDQLVQYCNSGIVS